MLMLRCCYDMLLIRYASYHDSAAYATRYAAGAAAAYIRHAMMMLRFTLLTLMLFTC